MPFFIRNQTKPKPSSNKVKKRVLKRREDRPNSKKITGHHPTKKAKAELSTEEPNDEEITSEEDDEFFTNLKKEKEREKEHSYKGTEDETPQEKKVRLAQQYLEDIRKKKEEEDEGEDEEDLHQAVGQQLKEDILEAAGKLQRSVADKYIMPDVESINFLRCKHQKLSLTCVVVSNDGKFIFTASKDCSIVKWTIDGIRENVVHGGQKSKKETHVGHTSHILSLALSMDSKYLASGDVDAVLHIWDPSNLSLLHTFKNHKGPISGLAFRRSSHMLYSASHDRLVMCWNLDVMSFAESFGGHHSAITGIDAFIKESCVTSGGSDEMIIVYVIPDEKQLRFNASQGSVDGIKLVNERTFVTFGQNGSLALWTTLKKKAHFIVNAAHGKNPENGEPYWLTSAAVLVNADVAATGSMDGFVRLWKIDHVTRKFEAMFSIPVPGVVNALEFTSSGSHLIAAVGQEHKLGRWFTEKSAKNSLVIIPLKTS